MRATGTALPPEVQPTGTTPAADEFPEIPPGPVAVVNGKRISRAAFIELYRPLIARTGRDDLPRSMKRRFQYRVLQRLVYQEQLRLEATKSGVDYDPAKLEETWKARRAKHESWQEHLGRSAETEKTLRQAMINDLREEALVDRRVDKNVTEADLKKAYEEAIPALTSDRERIRAAHLMIVVAPRGENGRAKSLSREQLEAASEADKKAWQEAALARAKALRKEALEPKTDFHELAREHSEGPGAFRGGDMGYFDERLMIPAYTKAAMALKVGEISQPVLTERGYFVIKLIDRQPPGTIPFEAMRESIADQVKARRLVQAMDALKQELERTYPSKVLLDLERPNKGGREDEKTSGR